MNGLMNVRTYPVFKRQKISDKEALRICEAFKNGYPVIKLAEEYGMIRGTIYAILRKNKVNRRHYELQ